MRFSNWANIGSRKRRWRPADQVAKKGGDKRLQVRVESSLGAVYMLTSNPDDAEGLLTKSLALARDVGDAHLIATALNNLGEPARVSKEDGRRAEGI